MTLSANAEQPTAPSNEPLTPSVTSAEPQSKRRRQDEFQQLFNSISSQEQLLESYSCALNRDILIQGRMYLGEEHICFHANILGWVTNVVISFRDVVAIEKRNTAYLFPNAIQISTLHHRYFFASFLFREEAYSELYKAWRSSTANKFSDGNGGFHLPGSKDDIFADDLLATSKIETGFGVSNLPLLMQTRITSDSEKLCSSCGCELHYSITGLCKEIDMPLSSLHSTLFDQKGTFWEEFYSSIYWRGCNIQDSSWEVPLAGGEQRKYKVEMPLLELIKSETFGTAHVVDKYLVKQPKRRYVIESVVDLEGLPGGICQIVIRYCLVPLNEKQSNLLITFEAYPPKTSFFKKAIRTALLIHFVEFFNVLSQFLTSSFTEDSNGATRTNRKLSWWKRDSLTEGGSCSRNYFDLRTFCTSLFWLLPILFVLCPRGLKVKLGIYREAPPRELGQRIKLLDDFKEEFSQYMGKQENDLEEIDKELTQLDIYFNKVEGIQRYSIDDAK